MNSSRVGACPRRRPSPMPRRAAGRNAAAWRQTQWMSLPIEAVAAQHSRSRHVVATFPSIQAAAESGMHRLAAAQWSAAAQAVCGMLSAPKLTHKGAPRRGPMHVNASSPAVVPMSSIFMKILQRSRTRARVAAGPTPANASRPTESACRSAGAGSVAGSNASGSSRASTCRGHHHCHCQDSGSFRHSSNPRARAVVSAGHCQALSYAHLVSAAQFRDQTLGATSAFGARADNEAKQP